ncbi:TetR/AcrR family transcriptional regulator [Gordonia sp. (in: high G+C Gram-positive bacteria)]|uniref:TetR/AcrR family transcriptional regulator n=1 Tax=Gordonia sp. (in: high G+C Gram-positive bacteria) TaxID=84139 RepID=UPI003C794845
MTEVGLPATSRGRATREKLIDAAKTVFAERGFVDARVSHIAKAAHVAYGTFYTHFESKEAIFYQVADELFREMFAPHEPVAHADESPAERLTHANRVFWDRYRDRSALMAIVEQVATIDPEFAKLRHQHRAETNARTANSIRHWQQQGLVPADLNPHTAAQALGAMVDRTLYLRYVLGENDEPDTAFETVNALAVRALGLTT